MPWDDDKKKGLSRNWDIQSPEAEATRTSGRRAEPQSEGAKIDELVERAEPLIEQVNSLYGMYLSGLEKLPPNERRRQLETLMTQLLQMHKPNSAYKFRIETVNAKFNLFREKWDRIIRDLESGKIKRAIKARG